MRLSAPKFWTWIAAAVLFVAGILLYLLKVLGVWDASYVLHVGLWAEAIGAALLLAGTYFKGF